MKKTLLSLFALFITTISFAYDAEIDGIYYNFNSENKTAEVTYERSFAGSYSGDIIIPEKINYNGVEYSVTFIGDDAFGFCTGLTSIEIPNSVTEIGERTFANCRALTSIEIPNSVTEIGERTFANCTALTSIDVDVNNKNYASVDGVLYDKNKTTLIRCPGGKVLIEIPNSVTSIGDDAFNGCAGLTSIEIPNSLTVIGSHAFSECTGLTSIKIPNSVTAIGSHAFSECTGLTSIKIPNSVTAIGSHAFYECTGLTSIEIPNSVTFIGDYAFCFCAGLTSIEIPNSVTAIGSHAFYECTGLTSIEIPNSVTEIGSYVFEDCTGLTSIKIPNSVTEIGSYAFNGCTGLTSIEIPNSVTYIGNFAFSECTSLISVIWNATRCKDFSSNTKIPFGTQIVSFTFGDAVEYIPAYLCYGMDKLTSISIPNSVTLIGDNVFEGCSSLSSVKWNVKKYNDFSYKENLFATNPITSFTFGNDVERIPAYLCYNMTDLSSVVIPNSVTEIGASVFEGCGKMRTVEIGKGITSIGNKAFASCSAIYSMGIDAIIPPIVESSTFDNVSRTTQIKVPCSAVAAYQASSYWNEFTNYVETPYTLVVNTNDNTMGNAIVVKQPTCQDISAQVQAQALPGYEFVKWSDGFTENPHTVFVTSDTTITAEFRVASTPVENTYDSNVKIYANGGNLHIEGIIEDYQIFDAFGRLVYIGRESMLLLPRGVYVVVVGDEVVKVVL